MFVAGYNSCLYTLNSITLAAQIFPEYVALIILWVFPLGKDCTHVLQIVDTTQNEVLYYLLSRNIKFMISDNLGVFPIAVPLAT